MTRILILVLTSLLVLPVQALELQVSKASDFIKGTQVKFNRVQRKSKKPKLNANDLAGGWFFEYETSSGKADGYLVISDVEPGADIGVFNYQLLDSTRTIVVQQGSGLIRDKDITMNFFYVDGSGTVSIRMNKKKRKKPSTSGQGFEYVFVRSDCPSVTGILTAGESYTCTVRDVDQFQDAFYNLRLNWDFNQ